VRPSRIEKGRCDDQRIRREALRAREIKSFEGLAAAFEQAVRFLNGVQTLSTAEPSSNLAAISHKFLSRIFGMQSAKAQAFAI
jgi:hypothetical protein